jgi:hypothetical protein
MRTGGVFFFLVFLVSCSVELPDKEQLIEEYYQVKVENLRTTIIEKCRKEQIARADADVDSIVHRLLNADLHDTLNFPPRPTRPVRPDPIIGTVQKFDLEN